MAQGRNNAAVAAALGLSERAVEKHINSVFAKLALSEEPDAHRRVKAVLLYLADHGPDRAVPPGAGEGGHHPAGRCVAPPWSGAGPGARMASVPRPATYPYSSSTTRRRSVAPRARS